MTLKYAVRFVAGMWKPIKVDRAQAHAMLERGEPMLYESERRAWAVARRKNRERDRVVAEEQGDRGSEGQRGA